MRGAGSRVIAVAVVASVCACSSTTLTAPPTTRPESAPPSEPPPHVSATSSAPTTPAVVGNGFSAVADALTDAEPRWTNADISNYQLVVAEQLNYWSRGCTWTNIVSGGLVTDTKVAPAPSSGHECPAVDYTVEQLHSTIARYLRDIDEFADPEFGVHRLEVSFDDVGVPTAIEYDLANADDEESSMQVSFTPTP